MWRLLTVVAGLGLAGCAVPVPEVPQSAERALYPAFPVLLFRAAEAACTDPEDRFSVPAPGTVVCESLPPPEAAASLILSFNGAVDRLPTFVSVLQATEVENGFVVAADTFARVPQRDGGAIQVRLDDPVLDAQIREIFEMTGGRPF